MPGSVARLAALIVTLLLPTLVWAESSSSSWSRTRNRRLASRRPASAAAATVTGTVKSPNAATVKAYFGPGLILGRGAGLTLNFGAMTKLSPRWPVYVGGELGLIFIGGDMGVQLLPTAYYLFDTPGLRRVQLYAGVSIGPTIYTDAGVTAGIGNITVRSASATSVLFTFWARPGAEFTLTKNFLLSFEPKFGMLGSSFAFAPQVAAIYGF